MTDWSASRIKSWHRCPTKYRNEHILGLGSDGSSYTDFGDSFHRRCENRLLVAMGLPPLPDIPMADPYEQARLDALWAGYEARWDDSSWRVLGAEVPFSYELAGHVITSHKGMDGLIQNADGRVQVVEHKTTGSDVSPGSNYYERLSLDVQCSIYIDAAASMGYGDVDVLYDVVSRPRHERKLATPEAERTYTQGKGCKVCGGKAKGVHGSGRRIKPAMVTVPAGDVGDRPRWWCRDFDHAAAKVANGFDPGNLHLSPIDGTAADPPTVALVMDDSCPACNGSGWEEAPRLHKGQRDTDETPDEFHDRILADIAERPDDFYQRTTVTRTEAQKERARSSILDTIKLARIAEAADLFPMNDSACFAYNTRCMFFGACTGAEDINDRIRFPLRSKP